MTTAPENSGKNPDAIPSITKFRDFHASLPLGGEPPNHILTIQDDLFFYLLAAIRNEPRSPPEISPDDWHNFLRCLPAHGIIPLIAWHIKSWPENCRPPGEIMAFLSQTLFSGGARSLRIGRQVQEITSALEAAGIPVLLIKGPALARTVYPDPALRHSSDIDLLVKPEDVLKCEPLFAQLGYTCPAHSFRFARDYQHHQQFFPPGNESMVELHWVMDNNFHMFRDGWLNDAFDRKIRITSEDLSCYTLHPVDHLTFLAFHHVFQHQSLRLDWICDIAFLKHALTVPEDWENLRSSCVLNNIRIPLQLALTASILWRNDDIPENYRDFSQWPSASAREQKLWRNAVTRQTTLRSDMYLNLQGRPTVWEKLRFCWQFIFPPVELMQPYRESESYRDIPLAYIRRWFQVTNYKL